MIYALDHVADNTVGLARAVVVSGCAIAEHLQGPGGQSGKA